MDSAGRGTAVEFVEIDRTVVERLESVVLAVSIRLTVSILCRSVCLKSRIDSGALGSLILAASLSRRCS